MKSLIILVVTVTAIALKGIQGLELVLVLLITAWATGYFVASILNLFYTKEELKEFEDET